MVEKNSIGEKRIVKRKVKNKKPIRFIEANVALKEDLKNNEFCKEYEALQAEFQVANQIINLRKKFGYTQKMLAERVGTTQTVIARMESMNYDRASLSMLRRIGKATGTYPVVEFREIAQECDW